MTGLDFGIVADFSYALRLRFLSNERVHQELIERERELRQLGREDCSNPQACADVRQACDRLEITYGEMRRRSPARSPALRTY